MHVSSLLHMPIIHLAFPALLSPLHYTHPPLPLLPSAPLHPSLLLFLLLPTALRLSASPGASGLQGPSRWVTLKCHLGWLVSSPSAAG